MATDSRRGFSLVELLVVLAVIGTLIGLLLPAIQAARESARRTQCASQLRQLGVAATLHASAKGRFPPGVQQWFFDSTVTYRGIPLFAYLCPYIEESAALLSWDYTDPMHNSDQGDRSNTALVLPFLVCPSDHIPKNPILVGSRGWVYALTSYGGNGGTRSFFPTQSTADGMFHTTGQASEPVMGQRAVRPRDVMDGLSHTLLFGERSHDDANYQTFTDAGWGDPVDQQGWWGASTSRKMIGHVTMSASSPINYRLPFDFEARSGQTPPAGSYSGFQAYVNLRICAYGSEHPGGANVCLADGSMRFLTSETDLGILRGMSTRAGAEIDGGE